MRVFLLFLLFLTSLFSCFPCFAASPAEPAFRKVEFVGQYPWSEGFRINLIADEALCRKNYGNQWRVKCAANPGRPGATVKDIKMSPRAEGYWQWLDSNSMIFVPKNAQSIKPDTLYTVNLQGLFRPDFVRFDKDSVSYKTLPLSAKLLSLDFWIDPSSAGKHRLAASFEFNFPALSLVADTIAPTGTIFGKPEMVWNSNRDHLNISWPVKSLGKNGGQASVVLPGLGQIFIKENKLFYNAPNEKSGGAVFNKNIPGEGELFFIRKAEVRPNRNSNLDMVYELVLETSLYARAEDVLNNLRVLELPKFNSPEAKEPYNWKLSPGISAQALDRARKPLVIPLQKDDVTQSVFRFEVKAEPGSYLFVGLDKNLKASSGNTLDKAWRNILQAEPAQATLGFMQQGNILPLSSKTILDIHSTDLERIEWRVQKVLNPFMALLAACSSDTFGDPVGNGWLEMDAISESVDGEIRLNKSSAGKAQFSSLDLAAALAKLPQDNDKALPGLSLVTLDGYNKGERQISASKLVLVTDLGLIIKEGATGVLDCFAYNLSSGQPVENAEINILGANGKVSVSGRTDNSGHAKLPAINGLKRESRPVAAIARHAGDLGWLPLRDKAREVNYSEYNTGGNHILPGGVIASIFSQREIYRPGDWLHFGTMTRNENFSLLNKDIPLFAEIIDPRGVKVWEKIFQTGPFGLAEISWQAPANCISGKYILNTRLAKNSDILASKTVRLEEFQPDTLRLKIDTPIVKGWLAAQDLNEPAELKLFLQNLYGTAAKNHKIKISLLSSPAIFKFSGYENYIFSDPLPFKGEGVKLDLPECLTDSDGVAIVRLPQDLGGISSALITVQAEGFEAGGGRATRSQASFLASPMNRVLGYKPLASLTNLNFIPLNNQAELEFLALDNNLKPVSWNDLDFSISRKNYVTNLVSDGAGGFRYDEVPVNMPVKSWQQNVNEKGARIALATDKPGEFLLIARSGDKLVAQIPYVVAGNTLKAPDEELAYSKMRMRLDKNDYDNGESINIALSLPFSGTGLITLEREGVFAHKWFNAKAGDCIQTITVPEDFEGKGYISVSFARNKESADIYMKPYIFAAAPFKANITKRDLKISLATPSKVMPGQTLEAIISSPQPAEAIVFAVDEGILQLTGFQTPRPLFNFLEDRALDVKTIQALELIMPDHVGIKSRISSFGGGMSGSLFGLSFNNPFRRKNEPPVASWSKVVRIGPEQTIINIPIPEYYNGKLRLMAVASSSDQAGSVSKEISVTAPVVLTPQLPLAVAPNDHFYGSLIIANTTNKEMPVSLRMTSGELLELIEPFPGNISLKAGEEKVLNFRMKAADKPGMDETTFEAKCPAGNFKRSAYMSVRPASPLRTTLLAGVTGQTGYIKNNRKLYDYDASTTITVSALPLPLARGFFQYLDAYPYGCSEQLVSRSLAQLLLRDWPGLGGSQEKTGKLVDATLTALRARFNGSGITLWPDSENNFALTVYAADFLLALGEAGIRGGDDLLQSLGYALENGCALNDSSLSSARICAYAIWVLTRQGKITTQLLENLLEAMAQRGVNGWENDLTASLIAASQKEMQMRYTIPFANIKFNTDGWFDEYAQYALHMTILARYFPEKCTEPVKKDFFAATRMAMTGNQYATFSAAQGIRALLALAGKESANNVQIDIDCVDGDEKGQYHLLANGLLLDYVIPQCSTFRVKTPGDKKSVYWQISTTGYDMNQNTEEQFSGIEISREYLDGNGQQVKTVNQGDELTAHIRVRAMDYNIKDCVISDLLPGGCEMILTQNENISLPENLQFMDRKEDRILLFGNLTNQPLEISYRIRAVNPGLFAVPPISAEAMYDKSTYGHGEAGFLKIVK